MKMQNYAKLGVFVPLAGLLMGNQSCEQQKVRELKKIIELDRITSQPLMIPGGPTFDFQYVANQQADGVFMESDGFAIRKNQPFTVTASGIQAKVSSKDLGLLTSFQKRIGGSIDTNKYSTEATCLMNLPMVRMRGSVNSFEIVGGGGVSLGFNPAGPLGAGLSLASLNFQVDFAQMDMSMQALHPLTGNLVQASNVTATQTKTRIGAGINLGLLTIGPSGYYQTPLSKVTKTGLGYAVSDLKKKLASEPWHSRVIADHDTHLTVYGGRNVNMAVGDQLAIYNDIHYWDGEPCQSTYRGGVSAEPVAVIQVEAVGDEISMGKVIKQTDINPVIGSRVSVFKLFTPPVQQAK